MAQCSGLAQALCARCGKPLECWPSRVGRPSRRLAGGLRSGIQNNGPRNMDAAVGGRSCMNRVSSNYGTLKSAHFALLGIGIRNALRTRVEARLQAGCILCHTRLAGSAGCLGIRWPSAFIQPKVKSSAGSGRRKPYRAIWQTETRAIFGDYFACDFKSLRVDAPHKSRKTRHNA